MNNSNVCLSKQVNRKVLALPTHESRQVKERRQDALRTTILKGSYKCNL